MKIDLVKEFGVKPMAKTKKFFFDRHIQGKQISDWLGDTNPVEVGRWLSENKPIPAKYKDRMDNLKQSIIEYENEHCCIFNLNQTNGEWDKEHGIIYELSDNNEVTVRYKYDIKKKTNPPTPKRKTSPPTPKHR
jgi:hypothetical protein